MSGAAKLKALASKGPNGAKLAAAMKAMSRKGWTLSDVRRVVAAVSK